MNCLIRSRDLFLNYSVALSRCNAVCVCRVVLPARGDVCGTHCADLVGVAQAELGRKRASDVTEKVARAMWTSLLAFEPSHPCHIGNRRRLWETAVFCKNAKKERISVVP